MVPRAPLPIEPEGPDFLPAGSREEGRRGCPGGEVR